MSAAILAADGGSDASVVGALGPMWGLTQIHPDEDVHAAVGAVARNALGATDAEQRLIRLATIDRLDVLRSEWSLEQRCGVVDAHFERASLKRVGSACAEDWPTTRDLPGLPPVPSWDDALLPAALRPSLIDIAERAQCPAEFTAVGAIVALASVIGRVCAIRPKQHDNWTVAPNLWGAVVGPPGAMKTPALSEAMRPVQTIAAQASHDHAARSFERDALEAERKALVMEMQTLARKGGDVGVLRQRHANLEAKAAEAANERRFIVYDTSIEALGEILRANPRGVLMFRDELVGFLKSLDRQGHECDRAFYLEAWNGTGAFVSDRIGRGTVRIEAACVSILGGIQPGPLGQYLRDATSGGGGADGLMQRFQLLVYPDPPRSWHNIDRPPDAAAFDRVCRLYQSMAELTPEGAGAETGDGIPFVRFDAEAQAFFDEWLADLMNRLRSGEEHEAIEGHLVKYGSLMPSLALIFQLADFGRGPVVLEAAQRAAAWCTFLEAHARRVYASVSMAKYTAARLLLAKIRSGKLANPFVARDVYRAQWSGLSDRESVDSAIDALVDHGWARRELVPTAGRDRTEVHVHPSVSHAKAAK
jgi:hypothetical protein